jgi:chemotaxis protein MotC
MKRLILIAAASTLTLSIAGAGAFFFFRHPQSADQEHVADADGELRSAASEHEEPRVRVEAARLIDELGHVQDRVVQGDRTALTDQTRLLRSIAKEIRTYAKSDWANDVNVRTALLYVLSGGDARVLRPLLEVNEDQPGHALSQGIMSYALGQAARARTLFEDIDPRSLDVSLVGPFSLARASLYLNDDHAKAIEFLDDARLSCPHTAIHEAAARREIPILLKSGNSSRALMIANSYIREFGKSIYAWKLYREFSEELAKRPESEETEIIARLVEALDDRTRQYASPLYLAISNSALRRGRLKLSKFAAERVLEAAGANDDDVERAKLYLAAAQAPSDEAMNAKAALDRIPIEKLSEDDNEIREVAGYIAQAVASEPKPGHQVASTADDGLTATTAALDKANRLLQSADEIGSGDK